MAMRVGKGLGRENGAQWQGHASKSEFYRF
jgi:hypothetical protein